MALLATNGIARLATVAAVDMNTATPTALYTVPATKEGGAAVTKCVLTHIVIRDASVSLTTVSLSVGWNSAAFNDVLANATHTELTAATLYSVLAAKAGAAFGDPGDILKLLCNTLQGAAATASVDVFGYIV